MSTIVNIAICSHLILATRNTGAALQARADAAQAFAMAISQQGQGYCSAADLLSRAGKSDPTKLPKAKRLGFESQSGQTPEVRMAGVARDH
jgi:hypothetical protein